MPQTQTLNVDFRALSESYADHWVALDPETGEVCAVGESALEVLDKALAKGMERPFISFVVRDYGVFAPWLA